MKHLFVLLTAILAVQAQPTDPPDEEETTTLAPDAPLEDYPPTPRDKCHFIGDEELPSGSNLTDIVSERCLKENSGRVYYANGRRAVYVDDLKCGLKDIRSEDNATESDICYSLPGQGISKSFMHVIRLKNEIYYKDYSDVRKKRFKNRKLQLELIWNALYIQSPVMMDNGFQSLKILGMTTVKKNRRKRALPPVVGVSVLAMVQFDTDQLTLDAYSAEFEALTNGTFLGDNELDPNEDKVSQPTDCNQKISQLQHAIPEKIWDASDIDPDLKVEIGKTVQFKCPEGLKLSLDDDNFDAYDDQFTVLCTTSGTYQAPTKKENWPKCVNPCMRRLPEAPKESGMTAYIPPNTVPAGQYGKYLCNDATFGVSKGPNNYFEVLCLSDGSYKVPTADEWPVCEFRTTTVSPAILNAWDSLRSRNQRKLEYRYKVYQRSDGFEDFEPKEPPPYIQTITLPSIFGVGFAIICILICTKQDSPVCKICAKDFGKKDKKTIPLDKEEK